METFLAPWTSALATGIEAVAAVIVGIAALEAVLGAPRLLVPRSSQTTEAIRLRLGRWLSLALEFELAADILRTAITPSWSDLGKLAAIVVIRTSINFFLQRDIDRAALAGELPSRPGGSPAATWTLRPPCA